MAMNVERSRSTRRFAMSLASLKNVRLPPDHSTFTKFTCRYPDGSNVTYVDAPSTVQFSTCTYPLHDKPPPPFSWSHVVVAAAAPAAHSSTTAAAASNPTAVAGAPGVSDRARRVMWASASQQR